MVNDSGSNEALPCEKESEGAGPSSMWQLKIADRGGIPLLQSVFGYDLRETKGDKNTLSLAMMN